MPKSESVVENMVARVTREIEECFGNDLSSEEIAERVIACMRNPTTKMRRAACAAMSPGKRPTQRRVSERAKHAIRWRAMIDAALPVSRQPEDI